MKEERKKGGRKEGRKGAGGKEREGGTEKG